MELWLLHVARAEYRKGEGWREAEPELGMPQLLREKIPLMQTWQNFKCSKGWSRKSERERETKDQLENCANKRY